MVGLSSAGYTLPMVELVMDVLAKLTPALRFPADKGRAEECVPWVRGGTQASGATAGGAGGNWFFGAKYVNTNQGGAPQRLVWIPPEPGEESFTAPDSTGFRTSGTTHLADRRLATRVVPMTVDIWGQDYGDTELLANYVAAAIYSVTSGQLVTDAGILVSGGFSPEVPADRGVHYVLVAQFGFPVTLPIRESVAAQEVLAATRTTTHWED